MTMKTRILVLSAGRDGATTDVVDQWRQAVMGDARAREQVLRRIMRGGATQATVVELPRERIAVAAARAA
jgi:microcystin degradation protein MlrC